MAVDLNTLEWGDVYFDEQGHKLKYFPVHQAQKDVLESQARFIAALGGVRSGKTSVGMLWLMNEVRKDPTGNFLLVGPSFNILDSASIPAWQRTVDGTELQGRYVSGKNQRYELGTGGIIYVRSAQDDTSFEGIGPRAALLDEGGNVSEKAWHAIKRRLSGTKGRCLISTTPYPKYNWIPQEIVSKAREGDKNYYVRSFPSWLNPTIDHETIRAEYLNLPEWEFRMFYMGEYTKASGLVFPEFDSCLVDRFRNDQMPNGSYFGAIDWTGGKDAFAALVGLLDDDGCLWIIWEKYIYNKQEDILKTIDGLLEWNNEFEQKTGKQIQRWWCDHTTTNIRALRRMGMNARKADKNPGPRQNSIPFGLGLVRSRIRNGKLKILKKAAPSLIAESGVYAYPIVDGEQISNVPIDKNNHACDALRYLITGLDRRSVKRDSEIYIQER